MEPYPVSIPTEPSTERREAVRSAATAGPNLRRLFLPVLGLSAVLYLPWLALSRFEPRQDALRRAVPWFAFFRSRVLAGDLPSWDPSRMAGFPHLATIDAATFYPVTWLLLPLPPHVAVGLSLVLHVGLGGVLLALFARSLPISDEAAALAGMAYVAGAGTTARVFVGHLAIVQAMAWLPLVLLGARRLAETANPRWAAMLGAATSLSLLAGSPAVAVYGTGAATLLFLACLPPRARRARALGLALLAGVFALLVVTPALWPLLELLGQSTRAAGISIGEASLGALEPASLPLLVWPWLFGAESRGDFSLIGTAIGAGYWHELLSAGGLVLWTLAIVGGFSYRREPPIQVLVVVVVGAILLAFGQRSPLYVWIHELFPRLRLLGGSSRFLLMLMPLVPVLAALGLQSLLDEWRGTAASRPRHSVSPTHVAIFLSLGVLAISVAGFSADGLRGSSTGRSSFLNALRTSGGGNVAIGALGIAALAALARVAPTTGRPRGLVLAGFYAAALAELVLVAVPSVYARPEPVPQWVQTTRDRGYQGPPPSQSRVALHGIYHGYANWGGLLGYRSATAYEPLLLARTTELLRSTQPSLSSDPPNDLLLRQDGGITFDVLAVGSFIHPVDGTPKSEPLVGSMQRLSLLPPSPLVQTKEESLLAVLQPGFHPGKEFILENQPGTVESYEPPAPDGVMSAELLEERPGFLRIRVSTPAETHLVFSESYYPGWVAEKRGLSVEMVPANHATMAVKISRGTHNLALRFTTPWLWPGLLASSAGVLGLAVLARMGRRR